MSLWDTGVKNFGFYFYLLPVYIEVLINTEILLVFKQLACTQKTNEQHDNLLELTKCICFYYFQQEDELEDHTNEIMKLVVIHNPTVEENPADVCVVIEGIKVLTGCGNRTTACILLIGLIYAFNLEYPKNLKYTFEVFQKLFLELDGAKLVKKVLSLKHKLLQ